MKQTLSTLQATLNLYGDYNAGWSWNGAKALVEYLEKLEADMGEEIEFDRVSLRCDFSEHESLVEWAEGYFGDDRWKDQIGVEENTLDEEKDEQIRNYIYDNGQLIEFDGGIIVSSF